MPDAIRLPRTTPESQGISSCGIIDFIAELERSIQHMNSFMLLRHGCVVAEGWWYPWRKWSPHMLFSLSKSFTSTAVGLAISEGRLALDDPVVSFFPGEAPAKISQNLAAMQVRHLLSMSTGHDVDTTERVAHFRDPYKGFLSLDVEHPPGTHFAYNSAATFMLSAIVQKLTGQTLLDYLTPRLFEPLGIIGATWESHPNGVNFGGWGLNLKTEDITRFGLLYLQKGQWGGRQILPEGWVELATASHVSNGDDPNSDWAQGYGFQFWRCRHNIYRGDGAFGQFCIIMPDQDAVLAMTGGTVDLQPVLNIVWDKLLPAMGEAPLPENKPAQTQLQNILDHLRINPPSGKAASPMASQFSAKTYSFDPNAETIKTICFNFDDHGCTMTYRLLGGGKRRGIHQLAFGYTSWQEGVSHLAALFPHPVAASAAWTGDNVLTLALCQYETPFIVTITCTFDGHQLLLDPRVNVSFGPLVLPQIVGRAEG